MRNDSPCIQCKYMTFKSGQYCNCNIKTLWGYDVHRMKPNTRGPLRRWSVCLHFASTRPKSMLHFANSKVLILFDLHTPIHIITCNVYSRLARYSFHTYSPPGRVPATGTYPRAGRTTDIARCTCVSQRNEQRCNQTGSNPHAP